MNRAMNLYCNRTLNLRSIQAVGYDMDYTLIHYDVHQWEERAYEYLKERFVQEGWPVGHLKFDPNLVRRGLVIDAHQGNILKSNRFGFVKRALHGTKLLEHEQLRKAYQRTIVDLNETRWVFLNTFFSLSEGCFYAQLVDLLDEGKIPEHLGYVDLYHRVRRTLDSVHAEGRLKAEIMANPELFVQLDPNVPLALLDQRQQEGVGHDMADEAVDAAHVPGLKRASRRPTAAPSSRATAGRPRCCRTPTGK